MQLLKQLNREKLSFGYLLILISAFHFNVLSQSDPGIGAGFQPSKDIIIKFKITRLRVEDSVNKEYCDYYFDKYGNDTAMYGNGRLYWSKKYIKNTEGKIIKYIRYDSSHVIQYIANYEYLKDGSFSIRFDDRKYATEVRVADYDKAGKIQSEFIESGTQHFYKYDSTGKLLGMDFRPGLCEFGLFKSEYNHDVNNRLVSLKTIHYPIKDEIFEKFFYDKRGIAIKSEVIVSYSWKDEKDFYIRNYSYVFKK